MERIERPWASSPEEILKILGVSPKRGLSTAEVRQRGKQSGPNRLREGKTRSAWRILLDQVKSLITLLLLTAGGVALAFRRVGEGVAIGAALLVNTLIGFFPELKTVRSMEALQRLSALRTRVRREGEIRQVPAETLVPGDLVILDPGELVSADLRLLEANQIQVDESTLTGESLPVDKGVEALQGNPSSFEHKKALFQSLRCVLRTAIDPYGHGFLPPA